MRRLTGLAAVLAAIGLAGCGGATPAPSGQAAPGRATVTNTAPADAPASSAARSKNAHDAAPAGGSTPAQSLAGSSAPPTVHGPATPTATPGSGPTVGTKTPKTARATAAEFQTLYFAGRFVESWELLAPSAKLTIPKSLWTQVHNGCRPVQNAANAVVSSITIFGNTAIVSVTGGNQSSRNTDHYLLSYTDGRWGYAPDDITIYRRGSVAADLAAARQAGFCSSSRIF